MPGSTTNRGYPYPLPGDPIDVAGDMQRLASAIDIDAASSVPGGTIMMTVATVAPTGYVLLEGGSVTNCAVLYPETWAVVPAGWKSGSNLLLPDARSRYPVAADAAHAHGTVGGSNSRQLASANLPQHVHGGGTGWENANHTHGGATDGQGIHHHVVPLQGSDGFVVGGSNPDHGSPGIAQGAPFMFGVHSMVSDEGNHAHNVGTGGVSANHAHSIATDGGPGSSAAFDITPAWIGFGFMMRLR